MNKFDVFINGIQLDHIANKKQVNQKASDCLKIPIQLFEKLLNSPNTRIRQSIPELKARQYKKILSRIGVICFYKPVTEKVISIKHSVELSTKDIKNTFTCPNCNHQLTQPDDGTSPNECEKCGIFIDLYLAHKTTESDKKETQPFIVQIPNEQSTEIEKNQIKKTDKQQSLSLQKDDLKKQPIQKDKKLKKRPLISSRSALALLALACISYAFFNRSDKSLPRTAEMIANGTVQTKDHTIYATSSQTNDPELLEQNIKPTTHLTQNNSESPQYTLAISDEKKMVSAISPNLAQYGTNQSFSSNSKTSQPIRKAQNKSRDAIEKINQQTGHIQNPFELNKSLQRQNKSSKANTSSKGMIIPVSNILSHFAVDNQEWDNFLTQKIDDSIIDGNLNRSFRLISCLTEPEKHISSLAKLLITSREEKLKKELLLKMEDKIKLSPIEIQPQLLSQVGRYQIDLKLKKDLYERAEKSLNALSDPKKRLNSALRIATSYYKDGNIKSTNHHLMKISALLPKINANNADSQITSRVAISRVYKDTGNIKYALQWIKDSENLINLASESAIEDLVEGYAYLDQYSSVMRLIKKAPLNKQSELLHRAARVYLTSKQIETAIQLNRLIQGATYKALSYILIATYSPENKSYSILAESVLNTEINSPFEKAIISSRLAQLYARQYNIYKTEKQLQLTKQYINAIPSSPKKDELLYIVATNYARSLMFKPATAFVSTIQSPGVKMQFNKEYDYLSKLNSL